MLKLNPAYDRIPFIFVTSEHRDETLAEIKETNPAAVVQKPYRPDELAAVIEETMKAR